MRSLVEVVQEAPDQDQARQKLRAALRRAINGVYCLFAGRGSVRVAAVEVWFTNGRRRCFLLGHEQARVNRPGRSWSMVFNGEALHFWIGTALHFSIGIHSGARSRRT